MMYSLKDVFNDGTEFIQRSVAEIVSGTERAKAKKANTLPGGLPVIDPRGWQGKLVPDRQWFVEGLIPDRTVTNLSGDGGSGKTEIILQLIAAASLQTQWFGRNVSAGIALNQGVIKYGSE
jgi:hypothetical protein